MSTIDLMGVSKRYGPVAALEDLDLHVAEGELVTMLGPAARARPRCSR